MRRILALMLICLLAAGGALAETRERVAVLEGLGIEVPEEAIADLSEALDGMPGLFAGWTGASDFDYITLLGWLGMGRFDEESYSFTPYCDDVYAFDCEMFDVVGGYFDLLDAVGRMSDGRIEVTGFESDLTEEAFFEGTGMQTIRFSMNGRPCAYAAALLDDWMDCGIIDYVNEQLAAQGFSERLWCVYDGGQGLIVFLRTADWAEAFAAATGCALAMGSEALEFAY